MNITDEKTIPAATEIIELAEHLRPLQVVSLLSRSAVCKNYIVTYAGGKAPKKQMLLRFFHNNAAFSHLKQLHQLAGGLPCIPKPLFMEDGYVLYPAAPVCLQAEDFIVTRKHPGREDLAAWIDKVKKLALAMDALHNAGLFYNTPDLKDMTQAEGKLSFWNLDDMEALAADSKEAASCGQKSIHFLGKLLYLSLLGKYPAYEPFSPETYLQTELAERIISEFCALLPNAEMDLVLQILRKCLGRKDLYATAGELAGELAKLQRKLRKESSAPKAGKKLEFAAADFLQRNPLYPYVNTEKQVLDIVMVGDGPMRDVFFRHIFASAQMLDHQLRFHIFSTNIEEFDLNYTIGNAELTPALAGAVTVTRVGYSEESEPLDADIIGKNPPLAELVLYKISRLPSSNRILQLQPGCVFFFHKMTNPLRALAQDLTELSAGPLLVALATDEQLDRSGLGIHDNVQLRSFPRNGLAITQEEMRKTVIYRRALKIHTYYEKENNERTSQAQILQRFEDPYSMRSSVRSALAMPYKLFACGLQDDENAAAAFFEHYIQGHDKAMMDRLVWLEHRSWQAFILISGWTLLPLDELEAQLFEETNPEHSHKDSKNKRHPCLYANFENPGQPCAENWDDEAWETGDATLLDPLDRLSVELYRMYSRHTGEAAEAFYQLLEEAKLTCKGLSAGKAAHLRMRFGQLLSDATNARLAFLRALKDCQDALGQEITDKLYSFADIVIKRNAHRDFKESDRAVIEAIPLMLQGTAINCIYKFYSRQLWDNVATSVFIEPETLLLVADESCGKEARENLSAFKEFFKLRGLQTQVSVIYPENVDKLEADSVLDVTGVEAHQVYQAQAHGLLSQLPVIWYRDQKLQSPNGSFPRISLYQSDRALSIREMMVLSGATLHEAEDVLLSMEEYRQLWTLAQSCSNNGRSYYNSAVAELIKLTGDDQPGANKWSVYAGADQRKCSLRMPAHQRERSGLSQLLQQLEEKRVIHKLQDSMPLSIVCQDPGFQESLNSMFAILVSRLSNTSQKQHFRITRNPDGRYFIYCDIGSWTLKKMQTGWLTSFTLSEAKKTGLLDFLRQLEMQDAIKPLGQWAGRKDKTTLVMTKDPFLQEGLNKLLEQLFPGADAAGAKYAVTVEPDTTGENAQIIQVREKTLAVKRENVPVMPPLTTLLTKMEEAGFIAPLSPATEVFDEQAKKLHFVYRSETIRESFCKEGDALEIFAYHTIRQMDLFDDVKLSVKLRWNKQDDFTENTDNEIDLICVKDTRSYFISCKKRPFLEDSFLTEIRYETDRFGVHGTPILLTTAQRQGANVAKYNRAARMGIHVITLQDFITDGQTPEDSGKVLRKQLEAIIQKQNS